MFPRGVTVREPKQPKLIVIPGPEGRGIEVEGQQDVNRDNFRSWHFRQLRSHHRVKNLTPSHR